MGNVQILENCEVGEDSLVEKILKSDVLPENLDVVIANAGIVAPTNFKSLSNTDRKVWDKLLKWFSHKS